MKHYTRVYIALAICLTFSCSSPKEIVKFPTIPDEEFANPNLKEYFKSTKTPNIVLRVPNNNDKATTNTSTNNGNDLLYNAIEKELLRNGFSVRDRGLFNELLNKSQNSDYSKIKQLTNTDLILEVVNIDRSVLYSTNKITQITSKSEKEKIGSIDFKEKGASAEYKLVLVKNNEIAGSYKFNYKPCPDGCELTYFKFTGKHSDKKIQLRETVEINTLEEFMKVTTKKLVESFKH